MPASKSSSENRIIVRREKWMWDEDEIVDVEQNKKKIEELCRFLFVAFWEMAKFDCTYSLFNVSISRMINKAAMWLELFRVHICWIEMYAEMFVCAKINVSLVYFPLYVVDII